LQTDELPPAFQTSSSPVLASLPYYQPGRWRLVSFDELDQVVLWVSHILIRHGDSSEPRLGFRAQGWSTPEPAPQRSRADAAAIAQYVASNVAADPESFGFFAAAFSDDESTRNTGGSLGGVRAAQLPAPLLDALQHLAPGGISKIVETKFGFHVLRRASRPPEQFVSGQRLVIRYAGCVNSEVFGISKRSREDAFRLASALTASGRDFTELIREYSEDTARLRDGDIGVWNTESPEHNGVELEALSSIAIGQLTRPLDTSIGIQVIKRLPAIPRPKLAAEVLQLRYDPTLPPENASGKDTVLQTALGLVGRFEHSPEQFDELRGTHCCLQPWEWEQGRGEPSLEVVLSRLAVGAPPSKVVDAGWYYLIPRRIEPRNNAPRPLAYDLPAPARPDVTAMLRNADGQMLSNAIAALRRVTRENFRLSESRQLILDDILEHLQLDLAKANDFDERETARRSAIMALQRELDQTTANEFVRFFSAWITERMLALHR
jgi:hypothetical protein